ncbi:cell division protein FtsL [Thauera aromatica]|uniref:Cell division protein FtsL n=1 Tax=Thauera aromatica K172 TaxID=44139 RepID=A0A2R4BKN1_THAAR|nr:cell division protein FtsL [Thauera aromatica]AVR87859.1 Cell division protein FtsL [Thauera aromatica K172]MCK2094969.1 cell division protein FtsL [Thauera aromatica]
MMRADAVLVALAVASALGVVSAQHQARKLHAEHEREQARARALEVEWGRLQLEQSTWAAHGRIESFARGRLGMGAPTPGQVLVVEPQS